MTRSGKGEDSPTDDGETDSGAHDDQASEIRDHTRKVLLKLHAFLERQQALGGSFPERVRDEGENNGC